MILYFAISYKPNLANESSDVFEGLVFEDDLLRFRIKDKTKFPYIQFGPACQSPKESIFVDCELRYKAEVDMNLRHIHSDVQKQMDLGVMKISPSAKSKLKSKKGNVFNLEKEALSQRQYDKVTLNDEVERKSKATNSNVADEATNKSSSPESEVWMKKSFTHYNQAFANLFSSHINNIHYIALTYRVNGQLNKIREKFYSVENNYLTLFIAIKATTNSIYTDKAPSDLNWLVSRLKKLEISTYTGMSFSQALGTYKLEVSDSILALRKIGNSDERSIYSFDCSSDRNEENLALCLPKSLLEGITLSADLTKDLRLVQLNLKVTLVDVLLQGPKGIESVYSVKPILIKRFERKDLKILNKVEFFNHAVHMEIEKGPKSKQSFSDDFLNLCIPYQKIINTQITKHFCYFGYDVVSAWNVTFVSFKEVLSDQSPWILLTIKRDQRKYSPMFQLASQDDKNKQIASLWELNNKLKNAVMLVGGQDFELSLKFTNPYYLILEFNDREIIVKGKVETDKPLPENTFRKRYYPPNDFLYLPRDRLKISIKPIAPGFMELAESTKRMNESEIRAFNNVTISIDGIKIFCTIVIHDDEISYLKSFLGNSFESKRRFK
jgi:hypothetical protein